MTAPLDLVDIKQSRGAIYKMRIYIPDGCGLAEASGYWCGSCISECWVAGTGDTARYAPFRNNTQVIAEAEGYSCARCAAFKVVR